MVLVTFAQVIANLSRRTTDNSSLLKRVALETRLTGLFVGIPVQIVLMLYPRTGTLRNNDTNLDLATTYIVHF